MTTRSGLHENESRGEAELSTGAYPHPHPHSDVEGQRQTPGAGERDGRLNPGDFVWNGGDRNINTQGGGIKGERTPPPAYASLSPYPASSSAATHDGYPYIPPHTHPEFGPTPMTAQHPLLAVPYQAYEDIGAPGAPDRRARWRFAGGLVVAVLVVVGVGGLGVLGFVGEGGGG